MTKLRDAFTTFAEWVGQALTRSIFPDGTGRVIDVSPTPPPEPHHRRKRPPWRP